MSHTNTAYKIGQGKETKQGDNVIELGSSPDSNVVLQMALEPFHQPDINFTLLEMNSTKDLKIELR